MCVSCYSTGDLSVTSTWFFSNILPFTGASVLGKELQHLEINIEEELPWLLCIVPLLSDSDLDHEWTGDYVDFPPDDNDASLSPADSYIEDPIAELGLYDRDEDLSGWTFKHLYDDSQWQERDLTLWSTLHRFTGPVCEPCLAYFLRFWPEDVLDRIVMENNR
jgi:hypothetical protein